jgi:hypothetical protein
VVGLEHVLTRLAWKTKRDGVHRSVLLLTKLTDVAVLIVESRLPLQLSGHLRCHLTEENSEFLLIVGYYLWELYMEALGGEFDLMGVLLQPDGLVCWPHCS